MSKVIAGHVLGAQISKALGLKNTRRIILDIGLDDAVLVYVEMIGTEKLYEVDFNGVNFEIKEKQNEN